MMKRIWDTSSIGFVLVIDLRALQIRWNTKKYLSVVMWLVFIDRPIPQYLFLLKGDVAVIESETRI